MARTTGSHAAAADPPPVRWRSQPAAHDYPAAASYLRLLAGPASVTAIGQLWTAAPIVHQKAKDVLRAAGLPLLGADDPAVAKDLRKIAAGEALAPVLLVRGDLRTGRALQIGDSYHRVCASYLTSEDTDIPCALVDLPTGTQTGR